MDPTESMVVSLWVTATLMIKDTQHFPALSGPLLVFAGGLPQVFQPLPWTVLAVQPQLPALCSRPWPFNLVNDVRMLSHSVDTFGLDIICLSCCCLALTSDLKHLVEASTMKLPSNCFWILHFQSLIYSSLFYDMRQEFNSTFLWFSWDCWVKPPLFPTERS